MKPGFALSLSFDGITLLQRSAAGWRTVGEADPRSADLTEALAALRRSAAALSPGGFQCKLVIPDDQIRYILLETGPLDDADRHNAAYKALEGATPYAVSELVFDVHASGDITQVAAVARDTLREAEVFAVEHRLNPVCFSAWPAKDGVFGREPFFGMTDVAEQFLPEGETVDREEAFFATFAPSNTSDGDIHTAAILPVDVRTTTELRDVASTPENAAPIDTKTGSKARKTADANFVSRRRVPTFQTGPSALSSNSGITDGSVPGFGEPPTPFEPAPKPKTRRAPNAAALPAPSPVVRKTQSDEERFTIYGARSSNSTSRRMGGIGGLLLVGLMLVAGLAAFASGALSTQVTDFLARLSTPSPVAQFTAPLQPQVTENVSTDIPPPTDMVALDVSLSDEDTAVLNAMRTPLINELEPTSLPQTDEVRAAYAASGIWHVAPEVPSPPPLTDLGDLYVTTLDPISESFDAVALPNPTSQPNDSAFLALASPAPAGTSFDFDARGLVVATASGTLTPDGVRVFAGEPDVRPPEKMVKLVVPIGDLDKQLRLAPLRPKARPAGVIQETEPVSVSSEPQPELRAFRPKMRPQPRQQPAPEAGQASALASASLVPLENAEGRALLSAPEGTDFDSETASAVMASLRPALRPSNLKAPEEKTRQTPTPTASAAAPRVAPKTVTPTIPSSASVSREATARNALNLRKVNLIGVYGKPSSRRALVRLSNGRYVKVKVGDRIDGGRISAIGDAQLQYQKSGRDVVLKMPRG